MNEIIASEMNDAVAPSLGQGSKKIGLEKFRFRKVIPKDKVADRFLQKKLRFRDGRLLKKKPVNTTPTR